MTANERRIIRDYLTRKRWYSLAGLLIHLVATTSCWWTGTPVLLGVFGGSAFILMFELQSAGNATTRTMLSLPVTANQLARCWRLVALDLPVVLFLIPLAVGAAIGAAYRAPYLTGEFFGLIALAQSLFLGIFYFVLTGLPGVPRTGASFWRRAQDIFFGLLWGLSIPAVMMLSTAIPRHFADFGKGGISAVILLAMGSVAGWFRADVLVRERAARPGSGERKINHPAPAAAARAWQRFGALPYLCLQFGTTTLAMLLVMLLMQRFVFFWLTADATRGNALLRSQMGMFVMITTYISFSQLLGQLRVLRTLPLRTSTLTSSLLVWPLGLGVLMGLLAQGLFWLIDGVPFDWRLFGQSVLGVVFITAMLPLSLRFGFRVWTLMPVMMLGAFLSSFPLLLRGGYLDNHWAWLLAAGLATFLGGVWWSAYRLLDSPHPWRAGAMKLQAAGRRM